MGLTISRTPFTLSEKDKIIIIIITKNIIYIYIYIYFNKRVHLNPYAPSGAAVEEMARTTVVQIKVAMETCSLIGRLRKFI